MSKVNVRFVDNGNTEIVRVKKGGHKFICRFKQFDKRVVICEIFFDEDVFKGVAKCNLIEDIFDYRKGKNLAFTRAFKNFYDYNVRYYLKYIDSIIADKDSFIKASLSFGESIIENNRNQI